jgi:AcrR family transcriptional regulator
LDGTGDVLDRLTRLFERIYQEVVDRPYMFRLLHSLAFAPSQGAPRVDLEAFHRRMVEAVAEALREGMAQGDVAQGDPEEAAFLVLGVLSFCLDLDQCYPSRAEATRLARLLKLAFCGLEPRNA